MRVFQILKKFKKIIIYSIILAIVIKCGSVVFSKKETEETVANQEDEKIPIAYKEFDYGDYTTIRLLHTDTGNVEELALDVYLYGVVAAEMPASYEEEALKAQAIVARTYTIYKIMNGSNHSEQNADICDSSSCCQAWISKENRLARWEESLREENLIKIENAVNSTIGKVVLYDGQPIDAFFHSNSGGETEIPENVWGGSFPYLQSVETYGEEAYTSYASEIIISKDELIQKMLEKYSTFEINFDEENSIQILEYTDSRKSKKDKSWEYRNYRNRL